MEVAVRKKLRRIFTIMGTTALIFTITACGNRMDAMQPDSSYVADFFDIPDSVTGIERLLLKDDMAYMCCPGQSQNPEARQKHPDPDSVSKTCRHQCPLLPNRTYQPPPDSTYRPYHL